MKIYSTLATIVSILILAGINHTFAQSSKDLYQQKCGRCHDAFDPMEYTSTEWKEVVLSMKSKAALSESEVKTITALNRSESDKSDSDKSDSAPSWGGYMYTEYVRSPEKIKNFDLHYLALSVSGWINDDINYLGEFELEHGGKGDNTFVEQAYIDYWVMPNVAVKIGAMLTPFNRFDEFHEPLVNPLVTRPQLSREIGVSAWKDVGIDVHGYYNLEQSSISYDFYAINGLGSGENLRASRQYRDNNENLALGGRVNFVYRNHIEIGGSGYQGAWDDEGDNNLTMIGFHTLISSSVVNLYGEYASAISENPTGDDGEMSGYFVQLSRMFHGKYQPSIRYGSLDYLDEGDMLGRIPSKGDKQLSELALGFGFRPASKVAFKIEYTIFNEGDRFVEKDNNQIGLQAAIRF